MQGRARHHSEPLKYQRKQPLLLDCETKKSNEAPAVPSSSLNTQIEPSSLSCYYLKRRKTVNFLPKQMQHKLIETDRQEGGKKKEKKKESGI